MTNTERQQQQQAYAQAVVRAELSEPFDWMGIPALIKRLVKLYN